MKIHVFFISTILLHLCCNQKQKKTDANFFGPKVVEAHGYVVPKDSMAEPRVILVDEKKLKKIPAGVPKVVLTNTNVHPAKVPKVVIAGLPTLCTPGENGFSIPKTVPAVESPFIAGIPEIVMAKEAYAKDQNPQNFSFFGKLQGLKHGHIHCLSKDKSGNLWLGSFGGGVSKYDGKSFTHFTEKEGLSNDVVRCILEDKSGNIWFGTAVGVSKYDGKRFTNFTEKEGLTNNQVWSMLEDKGGHLWFGTIGAGVIKYDGKTFTHFTEMEGLSNNEVNAIVEDRSGHLWFGTKAGMSKYDGKRFTRFTEKEGLSNNVVMGILEDKKGNLWLGTNGGGVNKYDGKSFSHFTEKEGLSNNRVWNIVEDNGGNLWLGTFGGGVSKYDGKSFTHFTEKEGLSNNAVRSMLVDNSGNLWFGTNGGGMNKYDLSSDNAGGKSFTHFTDKEGLSNNVVRSILEDKNGNLWFGTLGGGVNKYDGKSFAHFTVKEGLCNNGVWNILEDKSGILWFGTFGGVSKYDGKSFTQFTDKEGLGNNDIRCILEDNNSNLWFGTGGAGVIKYDGKSFILFTEKEGLSNNIVRCILEDKRGNLWFGTSGGGVSKYDGKSFVHFTKKEGLIHNDVSSILEDKSGNLWFSTSGGGVSRYDGKSFTHFTEQEGLSNNDVNIIMEDKSDLWFGTRIGLSRLPSNFGESDVFFTTYLYEDGFSGIGVNFGKTMLAAKDGTIWIGADDRLTAMRPGLQTLDTTAPNIQLTGLALFNENIIWQNLEKNKDTSIVLGNGVSIQNFRFDSLSTWYSMPESLSLAYNNNYLTFNFVGITIQSPKKVRYQYKLEGLDKNWSSLTNRTEASYGNLPHGTYTFKIKAMNGGGYWSKELAYEFTIRPPWWKTWWAYFFYILAIVFAIWSYIRYRERSLRAQKQILEKKVNIRTDQLKQKTTELEEKSTVLEHSLASLKATQSQLIQSEKMASLGELTAGIAHEIQNPLNFVNNFSEVNAELIEELQEERKKNLRDTKNEDDILNDIKQNEQKINHHGKRADAIVKGMLQHSRSSTSIKVPTDINALADEFLRLSYHGLRAKNNSVNVTLDTDFDSNIGNIQIIPQDIGMVLLNLYNNAFYTVAEKKGQEGEDFDPTVSVSTKKLGNKISISVKDNGSGIPQKVIDKIFQPFFTTKPTGQGTGLGLSLAYDIVKSHGGELKAETKEREGSTFIIELPLAIDLGK